MAIFKKSIIIILCVFLAFSPLFYYGDFSYSYADDTWIDILDQGSETAKKYTVGAIKAALNYFGYKETFSYDISKAVWSWNYSQWDKIAKNAGLAGGLGEFNHRLKYKIDSTKGLQFFIDATGLQYLNDLYEAILDYYDLHEPYSKTIYSGEWFEDDDGNGCYVFQADSTIISYSTKQEFDLHVNSGTVYRFTGQELWINMINAGTDTYTINYNNGTQMTYYITKWDNFNAYRRYYDTVAPSKTIPSSIITSKSVLYCDVRPENSGDYFTKDGFLCILKVSNNYYLGVTNKNVRGDNGQVSYYLASFSDALDFSTHPQSVTGNYQPKDNPIPDDDTVFNSGDDNIDDFLENDDPQVTVDDDNGLPSTPPTDPYVPNETGGNVDPQDGDVNWHMPDIHVDWDLGDFSDIFPFSIPYDIIELFNIVDAEPVTPAIYQEVDFGAFNYTIDFDLSYFDEFMEYVRAMELFLYTLTLFIATRGIFKIY